MLPITRPFAAASFLLAAVSATSQVMSARASLETIAERTSFRETGRYDEVERLCPLYAETWPDAVRCVEFGHTPEGRRMLSLVVSRTGVLTPDQARERKLPVMVVQGGIHAGEIDGKDAGFLAIRQLLRGEAAPRALESFVLVFVPVFNVDGHERFNRWNRPHQNGPQQMGWRVTAQNLNLNRDYAKADAPEMQAMLRLLEAWDPILYADLHATDGAKFEHDVSNTVEPIHTGDPQLRATGSALLERLNRRLTQAGSLPLDFYPQLVEPDDPASGFKVSVYPPRFSTGYWALRNRFALLVETHSWKDYATRVRVTQKIILELAEMMAREGASWRSLGEQADARAERLGGEEVALDFESTGEPRTIDFRGYRYSREPSAASGRLATRYDSTRPEVWRVPLWENVAPSVTTRAPRGGYVIPPAHAAWMGERLAIHGIRFERVGEAMRNTEVETFRATQVSFSPQSFEGHLTAQISGTWQTERRDLPAGSLFVPIAQPKARLVMALLEPRAPDSYAAWGFFNTAFEQKEYMEDYVAEQVAAEMLASNPGIAAEFRKRLASDPEFAADPAARLAFFHRRHPSWDERFYLYPVFRIDTTRVPR